MWFGCEAAQHGDLGVAVADFTVDDRGLFVTPGSDAAPVGFFDLDAVAKNGERLVVLLVALVQLDVFDLLMSGVNEASSSGSGGCLPEHSWRSSLPDRPNGLLSSPGRAAKLAEA